MSLMKMRTQRGFTLMEVALAIAIAAIVIIMSIVGYQMVNRSEKVNQAVSQVETIVAAANKWRGNAPSYAIPNTAALSATTLITGGYVPQSFEGASKDGKSANPWDGDWEVSAGPTNNQVTVTLTKIPTKACSELTDAFNAAKTGVDPTSPFCPTGGTTFTVYYGESGS